VVRHVVGDGAPADFDRRGRATNAARHQSMSQTNPYDWLHLA
jgi:hypothetical protein